MPVALFGDGRHRNRSGRKNIHFKGIKSAIKIYFSDIFGTTVAIKLQCWRSRQHRAVQGNQDGCQRRLRYPLAERTTSKKTKKTTHGQNGGSVSLIGSATPQWMHDLTLDAKRRLQILHDLAVTFGGATASPPGYMAKVPPANTGPAGPVVLGKQRQWRSFKNRSAPMIASPIG